MSSSDRTLANGIKDIGEMADRIHVPKAVVDRAQIIFKSVHLGKNLKGRSTHAITAASLYIACRQESVPRTFKEICAVSRVSKKETARCFKLILKVLETSIDIITTEDFMSRFCGNLGKSTRLCYSKSVDVTDTWYFDYFKLFQVYRIMLIWLLRT